MPPSLVTTVLDIEREAEVIQADARLRAEKLVADAKEKAAAAWRTSEAAAAEQVNRIEGEAAEVRDKKIKELTASGDAALEVLKNVSKAAYDSGVALVMNALAGK
ncbi:MAG: hypothetical protein LBT97_05575 [Planctomycetota bacterium]|jgi:hypothetical protein|nr:hypothetical protein [Planctomycetota bacterium]